MVEFPLKNGCLYTGDLMSGAPHGKGKMVCEDDLLEYEGGFQYGYFNGKGTFSSQGETQEVIKGFWRNHMCSDKNGEIFWIDKAEDGDRFACLYTGEIDNNHKHGLGR